MTETTLYNAVALCGNNRVLQTYYKRRLPNYGVFDEQRYFTPGPAAGVFELGGTMFASTICEDIWVPELAAEAAAEGASVIFNVSASPFHAGKASEREEMLCARARDNGVWLAYCNLVGGQDELVFDGRSLVISPSGEVVARGAAFEEDLVIADFAPGAQLGASADMAPEMGPAEEVYSAIVLGLRDYVRKNGFTDVVLGLSGGIDSALTAAIATDALGAEHVHGVMMPSRYSSAGSVDDSVELAANLGIETMELPVEGPVPGVSGHARARVRGSRARRRRGEPAGPGARDAAHGALQQVRVDDAGHRQQERALGGVLDALRRHGRRLRAHQGRLQDARLRAVEVAQRAGRRHRSSRRRSSTRRPAPSCGPTSATQDSLPPYPVLDAILTHYVEKDDSRDAIVKMGFPAEIVNRVIRLTDIAEYKRRQGPMGVKITPKAFGKDRRMPVTNRYGG